MIISGLLPNYDLFEELIVNIEALIFIPQFVDRSGNTVFNIHERKDGRYYMPGRLIGQARFIAGESGDTAFEWIPEGLDIATPEDES